MFSKFLNIEEGALFIISESSTQVMEALKRFSEIFIQFTHHQNGF